MFDFSIEKSKITPLNYIIQYIKLFRQVGIADAQYYNIMYVGA